MCLRAQLCSLQKGLSWGLSGFRLIGAPCLSPLPIPVVLISEMKSVLPHVQKLPFSMSLSFVISQRGVHLPLFWKAKLPIPSSGGRPGPRVHPLLRSQRAALGTHSLCCVSKAKAEGSWVALVRWDIWAGGWRKWAGWKLQQARVTHPLGRLEAGPQPPRAPLGSALHPKMLCHAPSCGSGSLIPEFWEAWAVFPEGVSRFSKQIGCLLSSAQPEALEAGGGGWRPRGQSSSPWPCLRLAPPRTAWSRHDR